MDCKRTASQKSSLQNALNKQTKNHVLYIVDYETVSSIMRILLWNIPTLRKEIYE